MLDESPIVTCNARGMGWQQRLHRSLGHCFVQIVETLTGSAEVQNVQFQLIKEGPRAVSLKVTTAGSTGFLKVFDGADGAVSYGRERGALLAMSGSGLVPDILAFSDELQFVMTDWIDAAGPIEGGACQSASVIGGWMACYDAVAPTEPASGNWFGYLSRFKSGLDQGAINRAKAILSDIPLCGRVLSHNDTALHNYIWTNEGRLFGVDFEQATMRPRGWDFVTGLSALIERFPRAANEVVEAYSNGFSRLHRGALLIDELNMVAKVLFCARAISARSKSEALSWQ